MTDWQVESLRFTLFRTRPIKTAMPLWQTLTGEKPEKFDSQPRANRITEEGTIVLGHLNHTSDSFRVDWNLSPSLEQQQRAVSFPTLGSLFQIKGQFIQMMNNWLTSEAVPQTNRIALGSNSLIINKNKEETYKLLSTFLHHIEIDIENSYDLLYRINRPTKSNIESGLIINRLSKWSAVRIRGWEVNIGVKPEVIQAPQIYFASRLELDINTSQDNVKPLPKEKLAPLLQELSQIIDQLSKEGDRWNDYS